MLFVVLLLCSVCLITVHSFTLPVRLVIHRQNRYTGSLYGADSRRAAQEERKKLMEGVARGDSYEYEYDGKIMTYTPPATPLEAELPAQQTAPQASLPVSTEFVASYGLESAFTSRGLNQPLLPAEYEMAFDMFPRLRQAACDKVWPDQSAVSEYLIESAIHPPLYNKNTNELEKDLSYVSFCLREDTANRFLELELDGNNAIGELHMYLNDAVQTRNVTLFVKTLLGLNIDITNHIREVDVSTSLTRASSPAPIVVMNLYAFITDFLRCIDILLYPTDPVPYIQDMLLRLMIMTLTVLHAGLSPGQKSTIYYGDFLSRRNTGGYLPPAEAVELAVKYVFGKLQVVEDEEHPMECAYNVVKR